MTKPKSREAQDAIAYLYGRLSAASASNAHTRGMITRSRFISSAAKKELLSAFLELPETPSPRMVEAKLRSLCRKPGTSHGAKRFCKHYLEGLAEKKNASKESKVPGLQGKGKD